MNEAMRTCKMSQIPAKKPANGQAMRIRIRIQKMLKQPLRPRMVDSLLFDVAAVKVLESQCGDCVSVAGREI